MHPAQSPCTVASPLQGLHLSSRIDHDVPVIMPASDGTRYRLEALDVRMGLDLPMEQLDPLLEIAALDQLRGHRSISGSDVFASTSRFPFMRDGGAVRSAVPGLQPGFVLRDDGRIFSRCRFPDNPDETDRQYHFQAGVDIADGGARVALETAAELLRSGAVDALFVGPRLRPQLEHSVRDARGAKFAAIPAAPDLDGRGIVVGIVDYGCDFVHRNFRRADGKTRLLHLWDQNGSGGIPEADYGREFDRIAIDMALGENDPYAALGYDPHANYFRSGKVEAAHGTHVLDIAAGNGNGTGYAGMAPGAEIIFVQLRRYSWDGDPDLNRTAAVLDAVAYIFERAGDRPAVVNLSLGTNGGSHDGSSVVERTMDIFLRVPGRSIVIAAGNAGGAALHAAGTIAANRDRRLGWRFPAHDLGPNQLEIWADGPLALELTDPAGNVLGTVEPGATGAISRDDAHAGAVIGSRRVDRKLEVLTTVIRPSGKAGTWQVRLLPRCDRTVRFDAWIDRDDPGQSTFVPEDSDPACTLASLACGTDTVVVGAHYALAVNRDLAPFSSQGSTRDQRDNPHLTAPGCNVWAAASKKDRPRKRGRSTTRAPRIAMSGTSMAAPHVTGAIALLLQAHPTATAAALRDALTASADRSPSRDSWHAGYGFGWLNLAGALERLGGESDRDA